MDLKELEKSHQAKKRQQIVLTAAELVLKHGVQEVKMTDIAAACGIGVASLYRYFGTKGNLLIAAGTLLWQDVEKLFDEIFGGSAFAAKSGIEQLRECLQSFSVLYAAHKPFLLFLFEFDEFVLREKPEENLLRTYEKSVLDFWPVFLKSCEKGWQDGTVRAGFDAPVFYKAVTHALMLVAQKYVRGRILESDDATTAQAELSMLVEMAVQYVQTGNV